MEEDYLRRKESSASVDAAENKESPLSRRSSLQSLETDASRYALSSHLMTFEYLFLYYLWAPD